MLYLIILSILTIAAYTAAVCVKQGGVPNSISATFYKLEHKYWFMATMWLTAGLLMPAILEVSKLNTEFLAFFACAGMILVGAAPHFKEESEGKVHTAGAILCIVGSQVWVAFNMAWALFVWVAYLIYTAVAISRQKEGVFIYKFRQTKPMFWVEVAALVATYLTALISL